MTDDNCIFCKIAGGVIPSTTLYEDEDFRVILDLGPRPEDMPLSFQNSILQMYAHWMGI